ncbi:M15 family metallopeptidase [Oceanobacillus luteolus]|uniref:D-alanyl-D-alanine dipeptidase n=1 Tax=Oceanobacillus luteolus TaxID=1274358 RepID=A0ABW4HWR5_9BACI
MQQIPGSIQECYLRESAADRLLQAAENLPEGFFFHIFDAWRPYEVQSALYQDFKMKLEEKGLSGKHLLETLNKYVNKPSRDSNRPSNHLTGGAVDLTIATDNGLLPMGTDFDDFSEASKTDTYEKLENPTKSEILYRNNRALLKEIMENAGFMNYEEEWWHFDYGNQNWAARTGNIAFYGGIHSIEQA